jgi:hypothetical protein
MPPSKGKKLVYVPSDLIDEVRQASIGKGESISKFVEAALKQAVRINEIGYDLDKSAAFFEVMQAQRILGGVFVPLDVFNFLTRKAYKETKDALATKWYESGKWHGKYLQEKFTDPLQAFQTFLEISRWDLSEVEVQPQGSTVKVRCVSTVLKSADTTLLTKFIEGVMHSMDYKTTKSDRFRGMIVLEFTV